MTNYEMLPKHMQDGARLYIEKGIQPGGFLTAVLENNLTRAFHTADRVNRPLIGEWVYWLTWEIPAPAWGSPAKVELWIKQGGMEVLKKLDDIGGCG